jgi:hypothetical protein
MGGDIDLRNARAPVNSASRSRLALILVVGLAQYPDTVDE